jgi:hypothetical protein
MIRPRRLPLAPRNAVLIACLACVCLLPTTAASAAEGTVHYVKESLTEYEHQLAAGQIAAATINRRIATVRLTLKNGEHFLVHYGRHQEPALAAALAAKHVPVTILKPAEQIAEAKKTPVHHKLRYIAGGILIAVIVVVGAVLLVDRRRKAAME